MKARRNLLRIWLLCAAISAHCQGTMTYLSNLGQSPDGTNAVGSDSWLAEDFRTGTNAGGYSLDSIQLGMANAFGNPTNFMVMLYSATTGGPGILPGNSLGTLDGSLSPVSAGTYTFTSASNLMLSPRTRYFIVLTAETTVANGAYEWNVMNTFSYNPSDGWSGGVTLTSLNGSSWTTLPTYPQFDFSQFAIDATPVPEPGVLGLSVLGGLLLLRHRWKAKAV